jgi:hypothetical protein
MKCDCCENQVDEIRLADYFTTNSIEGHQTTRRERICRGCWKDSAGFGCEFEDGDPKDYRIDELKKLERELAEFDTKAFALELIEKYGKEQSLAAMKYMTTKNKL